MFLRRAFLRLVRYAFHLFYNPFAFTYDMISAIVSRGHWRDWTRAAIPFIVGARVLEVPIGTGNLHFDLHAAGYKPIGADLSANMLKIARGKFVRVRAKHSQGFFRFEKQDWNIPTRSFENRDMANASPLLVRARVEQLPFPRASFNSIVMTFPASFVFDPRTFAEFARVLDENGRVIWVDAPRLKPINVWNRALNRAINAVGGDVNYREMIKRVVERAGFIAHMEMVEVAFSTVCVTIAHKVL